MVIDFLLDHLLLFLLISKVRLPIAGHPHAVQRRELTIVMRRLVRLIVLIARVIVMPGSALICEAIGALILAIHAILLEVIACAKLLTVALIVSCRSFATICCQLLNSVALRVQCVEHTIARLLGACANLVAGAAAFSVLDSTRARVSVLLSAAVVDKVVVREPQRGRLEVALLAL